MTIYLVVIFSVHLLPNKVFAEFEFVTASIKVVMMVVIIIVCIAILCGAGPTGSTNWGVNFTEYPAFPHGFKVKLLSCLSFEAVYHSRLTPF